MTLPRPAAPKLCPSCGAPAAMNALTCQTCGAVIPLEHFARRGKQVASEVILLKTSKMSRSDAIAWILALTPMLLAPPIIAILLALRAKNGNARTADATWIVLAAALNILISLLIWRWIAIMGWDFLARLSIWLRPFEPVRRGVIPI